MSATVQYKGNTIATIQNTTKTLQTEGKYMEADVVITDVSSGSVTLQEKTNIDPTTSSQTITPDSGYDGLSSVQINAMPTGTAGTPTATKGTVSNHSVSVTPSVTNSTGYITGGTKTGTAVTVSASELVSGTLSITENGTANVTNYASVSVNVSSSGSATIEPLSVTQNGTYTAPSGVDGYSPVTVNVPSGGGSAGSLSDPIRFFDYDGTLVASYSSVPSSLPSNPSHSGLIAQGWNYTLAQIQTQFAATGTCDVGQMYITESGNTEIDINLQEGRTSPYLGIAVNGTVVVNWGDGSTSTVTGTSLTTQIKTLHSYSVAGKYTITISVSSGSFTFYGSSANTLLSKNNTTANANKVYANCVQNIRIGSGVTTIGGSAFTTCYSLESVTIPSGITSIGGSAFTTCYSLESVTIPSGVTTIGASAFSGCYSLASVTIPSGVRSINDGVFSSCYSLVSVTIPSSVTSIAGSAFNNCHSLVSMTIPSGVTFIGNNVFYDCYSLDSVTIPSSVTSLGSYAFQNCYSLASVIMPSGVTTIGTTTFSSCYSLASVTIPSSVTSIGSNAFYNGYSLSSMTIPSGVTSIGNNAFQNCYGMAEYHLLPTTPPTLSNTNAFTNIQSDCKIYVPSGSLSAYQSATNWSTYASYMVEE